MNEALELVVVGDVPAGIDLEPLQRVFSLFAAAADVNRPSGVINLSFVTDDEIRALNRDYSGHDYATDVLSFDYVESGGAIDGVIGELAVSYETAAKQAEAADMAVSEEVALLVLHGVLHLSGYDHQSQAERDEVQGLQQRLMGEAGYQVRNFEWQD